MFRSGAEHFGPRCIGVVLTGMLYDGTAGLWAIKDRGGTTIVQSPGEAEYPSMPASAIRHGARGLAAVAKAGGQAIEHRRASADGQKQQRAASGDDKQEDECGNVLPVASVHRRPPFVRLAR